MQRRILPPLVAAALVACAPIARAQRATSTRAPDIAYEATITGLQKAMAEGRTTSSELVDLYLARIAAYDHQGPALNAIIRVNPNARADARRLDAERRGGTVRGPLHGIPVLLKDNYATRDMPTAAASVALAGLQTADDAFQVQRLREAGAVILGKTNMHELAAGITSVSSLGGQSCNPYDPRRNPGGSSGGSGAAVAASFAVVAWGSDTCGSIRIPSAVHNLFGLRPTKGLSSTSGIVPLSHTQDVGGPIARSVMDLAISLDATIGADPADTATRALAQRELPRFVASLDSISLRGKRLAVLASYFGEAPEDREGGEVVREAIDRMKARGAEITDVTIPGLDSLVGRASVIDFEFKYDLMDFLAAQPNAKVASLADILRLGMYDVALEQPFRRRDSLGTRDSAPYREALARRQRARDLVVAFLDSGRYDALVYPTMRRKAALIGELPIGSTCALSAVTGLPALSVPAGFTPDGLPIGAELLGRPFADAALVAMAYDYEQSVHPRRAPSTTPPLVDGHAPPPTRFTTAARGAGVVARARFTWNPMRHRLDYAVQLAGPGAGTISIVGIGRDSADVPGAIMRRLMAQGERAASGALTLDGEEREKLLAGRLSLVVFSSDRAGAVARVPIVVERKRVETH